MRRLLIGAAIFAGLFSACWLYGLALAPGPMPFLLLVVGVAAPAGLAFSAAMVIHVATPPSARDVAARRDEWKAIEARKRAEITS